jgi:SAM-dependent methyltransferase
MGFTGIIRQVVPPKTRAKIRQNIGHVRRFIDNIFIRVVHSIKVALHPILNTRENVDAAVARPYQLKYGERFIVLLDHRDEMYQYFNSSGAGNSKIENQRNYFLSGQKALRSLKNILANQGIALPQVTSLLEFASGYGRITRFLVTRINPQKITVSDIDFAAVQSNSATFGTLPLASSEHPSTFVCDRKFEVIFVASLFTHLNHALWILWLQRLYELLEPGGLLIFSTRDLEDYPLNDFIEFVEDGFAFEKSNETMGRLKVNIYGTTLVKEAWVRKNIQEHGVGELVAYHPRKLWRQDVYVIRRPDSPQTPK